MPLGTEVGLGPGDIVLYENPAPPPHGKEQSSAYFLAHFALVRSPISATAELLYVMMGDAGVNRPKSTNSVYPPLY